MSAPAYEPRGATRVVVGGRELVFFGGCNYLALQHHPAVLDALAEGAHRYGISAGASRETTGNTEAHEELETLLAERCGADAAALLPDGYLANLALAQALARDCEHAFVDRRAHASIRDALAATRTPATDYDGPAELERALASRDRRSLARPRTSARPTRVAVWTDGVYPALGRFAPIEALRDACAGRALLCVDDCHGFGVVTAAGAADARGLGTCGLALGAGDVCATLTLSKAFGVAGGAVVGSAERIAALRARADAWTCTTPIPPALALAASAALRVFAAEPERSARLDANVGRVRAHLERLGLPLGADPHPVQAFALPGGTDAMRRADAALRDAGQLVPLVGYPGGPAETYFRLVVNAQHAADEIDTLAAALERALGA